MVVNEGKVDTGFGGDFADGYGSEAEIGEEFAGGFDEFFSGGG